MTNRFLISVAAAALLAGAGFANAQGTSDKHESGSSQQMQHAQPSPEHGSSRHEKGTVGQAGGQSGAMKSEKSEQSSGTMNKHESAQEKSGQMKGQSSDQRAQDQQGRSKNMRSENEHKAGTKDMKAEGRQGHDATKNNAENRSGTSSTQNAQGQNSPSTSTSNQTTGQAGAGAKLSTQQRTQITSVIREQHVQPVTNVNFSISVGTRIPRGHISLHPVPRQVVEIYPEWRGYEFILVRDEIVIVDPNTYEIVAVLNV